MSRINWARTSRMNWVYDNMGGSKAYEPVLGALSGYTALVEADGTVIVETPAPGGGLVAMVRGVWFAATSFSYAGFWANAEGGDLTNYFTGGSYENTGAQTIITLGTALTPGDEVQIYYFYDLGTPTVKGEAVNNFPCPRKAYRSATDFTYDYAVDRMFDLMGILHAAGLIRGIDYSRYWEFLWAKYVEHAASLTNPLFLDDFERSLTDSGRYLLYNNSDQGQAGFDIFEIQLYPGDDANPVTGLIGPRALRVVLPSFAASWHEALWGYGLNWDLSNPPLNSVDTLTFKLRTARNASDVHNLVRMGYAGGNANLIVKNLGTGAGSFGIVVYIDAGGALGTATYQWSKDWGLTWEATGLSTCDVSSPAHLFDDVYIFWETYGSPNFTTGDYWEFKTLDTLSYPQHLLVSLNDSVITDPTPWTEEHNFYAALPDIYETLTEIAIAFAQFWRRDNIVYDGDRVKGGGWGPWYAGGSMSLLFATERQLEQTISGEIFYTQLKIEWAGTGMTDWGMWTGLNTSEVDSTGRTGINLAVYPEISGAGTCGLRLKVKDAAGSYFHQDFTPTKNEWNRLTTSFASMTLESGSAPMIHPIALVDIGQNTPDASGIFYITDIKFDNHITFAGPNLRTLEFKYEENFLALAPPAYWLDDVSLNLEATDPYPWAPRVALSLGPNGLNPYRGPSLVHYAQPLAPHLMEMATETATFIAMHADAQDAFIDCALSNDFLNSRYPESQSDTYVKTTSKFGTQYWPYFATDPLKTLTGPYPNNCWVSELGQQTNQCFHIDYGKKQIIGKIYYENIHHSGTLTNIGVRNFTLWGSNTAAAFADLDYTHNDNWTQLTTSSTEFAQHIAADQTDPQYITITNLELFGDGYRYYRFKFADNWGYATVMGVRRIELQGVTKGPIMPVHTRNDIENIALLGSANFNTFSWWPDYPEATSGLGQYWAFMRLAHYYFVSDSADAWTVLDHWLNWINENGTVDGDGWKFPATFDDDGSFDFGDYDPGQTAAIAIGCLYCYMANEDSRANTWARRILDDLRVNRQSATYDYLYKSDLHYGWLNALVAHTFGLAVNGRSGSTYTFTSTADDLTHFNAMVTQFLTMAGDSKPNVLNADLLPFSLVEASDNWAFAPDYMMNKEYGSTEALVLMMNVALDYAIIENNWTWFDALLKFLIFDNLTILPANSIESITASLDKSQVANKVRILFGNFMEDNDYYAEKEDTDLITLQGEKPFEIDLRYGNPVIIESMAMATLLAERGLAYFSKPTEHVEITAWLEGIRAIIGETLNPISDFHGYGTDEFFIYSKSIDLKNKRVSIKAIRQIEWKP